MSLGYSFSAIFAMLLVILTKRRWSQLKIDGGVDKKFDRLSSCIVVYCIVDALWGAFYYGAISASLTFTVTSYAVYFLAGVSTLLWFNYMVDSLGGRQEIRYSIRTIGVILLIIEILLLISNNFTHSLFFINSESEYFYSVGRIHFQTLQSSLYVIIFIYGAFRILRGDAKYRKQSGKNVIYAVIPGLFGAGQILFIDVSMYSFGFALTVYAILLFEKSYQEMRLINKENRKEREERLSIINGLAGDFSTVYSIDAETGGFLVFNRTDDESFLHKTDNSNLNYFEVVVGKGRKMIHEDDLETFLNMMDKETIKKRFETENSFSLILRIRFGSRYKYIEYRFTDNHIGDKERIIIGVYDIDKIYRKKLKDAELLRTAEERQKALEEEAEILDKAANRDIMTGLFNRRAYENYIEECNGMPDSEDFVYVSIDLNGLKAVNDDLGHDAGDELIKSAAYYMRKILGKYGNVYRHGGDEFSAILHTSQDKLSGIFETLDKELFNFHGKYVSNISASYGYVSAAETGIVPIDELEKIADRRMYEAKSDHYARKGIDRRGQQEAYDVIRKSYIKILKVDLKTDSFATIYMEDAETDLEKGFDNSISKWIHDFAASGNVHPEDREYFIKSLTMSAIKEHFSNRRENIAIHYRRKSIDGYSNTLLEIMPAKEFGEDEQIVYLYVKNIY